MNKRVAVVFLICIVCAPIFQVRSGPTKQNQQQHTPRVLRIPERTRQQARKILESPHAKFISTGGLSALTRLTGGEENGEGEPSPDASSITARRMAKASPFLTSSNETMVNNPGKDAFTAELDASTQSETAVASFNNTVVVAYNDSGDAPLVNSFEGYSRSTNDGASFTDKGPMPVPVPAKDCPSFFPECTFNDGDPGLAVDRSGNFYASFIAADFSPDYDPNETPGFGQSIGISKSKDGGATFGPPVLVPVKTLPRYAFEDKPFIAVDNSMNSATTGNVYVTFTNFGFDPNNSRRGFPIAFTRSVDGGKTFSDPILLAPENDFTQGSEPVVATDGTVYVTWIRFFASDSPSEPPTIIVRKSTNGGKSFSTPVAVATLNPIGFGGGTLNGDVRVNSFPRIDVSPKDGSLYIVYASNAPGADGASVYITRSIDKGSTWSAPHRFNTYPSPPLPNTVNSYEFFPDVAVNREGIVQIIWYLERIYNNEGRLDERISVYKTRSLDKGVTFETAERINRASFSPAVGYDYFINPTYMGDYIDIKVGLSENGPTDSFLMTWADCRRIITTNGGTRNDQDVFFSADR